MKPLYLLRLASVATLMYTVYLITAIAADGPLLQSPLDLLVLLALATTCGVLASMWFAERLREVQRANAEHFDRRLDSLTNTVVDGFARLELTQEIPKLFGQSTVYQSATSSPALSPEMRAAGDRLKLKIIHGAHASDVRHEPWNMPDTD